MNTSSNPVAPRLVSVESNDWHWRAKEHTLVANSRAVGMREESSAQAANSCPTLDPGGCWEKPHYKMWQKHTPVHGAHCCDEPGPCASGSKKALGHYPLISPAFLDLSFEDNRGSQHGFCFWTEMLIWETGKATGTLIWRSHISAFVI